MLLLLAATNVSIYAQNIIPVKRFHEKNSPYRDYQNNFISGFMQTCEPDSLNGFLQMPFIGDPLLVYVGEKDSTQFTAYASGFENQKITLNKGRYEVDLTRYGIKADLLTKSSYCVQRYDYPDTTATKGFLIDLDHALYGAGNGDMDVKFIDRNTIRAYRRSKKTDDGEPELYYVAHFSHPFSTWNIRREKVQLKNGEKESRCKVAFTFELKNGELLTVQSAVSSQSTDDAYAQIKGLPEEKHFSDKRPAKYEEDKPLLAQNTEGKQRSNSSSNPLRRRIVPPIARLDQLPNTDLGGNYAASLIEITTRDAESRAAFYSAMNTLLRTAECKTASNGLDFLSRIEEFYKAHTEAMPQTAEQTDTILHQYVSKLFTGGGEKATNAQAAWYVFNALGFCPTDTAGTYRLTRPIFNVSTIYLPQGRRFIVHTKNISRGRYTISKATLSHQPLPESLTFTRQRMFRGGIMEVKMDK